MRRIRTLTAILLLSGTTTADRITDELIAFGRTQATRIAARADVIKQVEEQNRRHAVLSVEDITRLDRRWRRQFGRHEAPLIQQLMSTPLSDTLRDLQLRSSELITEILIMDNRGLNVAQSSITSDYWQGDEPQWQRTFMVGPGRFHISPPDRDDSTHSPQIRVSRTIADGQGNAIGAVTVGVVAMQF